MKIACPECGMPISPDDPASWGEACSRCRARLRPARTDVHSRKSADARASAWRTVSVAVKVQFAMVVFWIVTVGAILAVSPRSDAGAGALACTSLGSLCVFFLCLCMCGAAPQPAARRSILACILIPLLGTFALALGWQILVRRGLGGFERIVAVEQAREWIVGFGVFAVYFSAFAFLMRFHAIVAREFGNRWLRVESYVFLFMPIVTIAANLGLFWLTTRVVAPLAAFGPFRIPLEFVQTTFNFGVAVWYAWILWHTFRTIDRGPVVPIVKLRSPEEHEDADPFGSP
jgi:hypothetical protein